MLIQCIVMESRINHAFTPTNSQTEALKSFSDFLKSEELRGAFILRGAAGTGKSTITREFIALARSQRFNVIPMAPTGRAASVLAERVGKHTSTIHRCIYDLTHVEEVSDESEQPVFHFSLRANEDVANTLYIVDEASLISDEYQVDMNLRFGSGHLLKDHPMSMFADRSDCPYSHPRTSNRSTEPFALSSRWHRSP